MKKKLINWLCLSGVLGVIFYHLHGVIGAMNYPGYNSFSQAMSDLTATDAPSYIIASSFVTVYSIFSCLCCSLVSILIQREKSKLLRIGVYLFTIMNFVSAVGYSLFPLSSSGFDHSVQSMIHVGVTGLVVLLSIISLILIAIGSFKDNNKHRYLGVLALLALFFMFVGAIGSAVVPKEYFGLLERFSTYSAVVFNGILGIYGFLIFIEKD